MAKWPEANMAIMDESTDDVHRLHVTVRNKKNYKPIKGFFLNIERTKEEVDLKQVIKYKLITEWYVGECTQEIFDSFIGCIKGESDISEEAAVKVKEFDKQFDLLITNK